MSTADISEMAADFVQHANKRPVGGRSLVAEMVSDRVTMERLPTDGTSWPHTVAKQD